MAAHPWTCIISSAVARDEPHSNDSVSLHAVVQSLNVALAFMSASSAVHHPFEDMDVLLDSAGRGDLRCLTRYFHAPNNRRSSTNSPR